LAEIFDTTVIIKIFCRLRSYDIARRDLSRTVCWNKIASELISTAEVLKKMMFTIIQAAGNTIVRMMAGRYTR
jgi:hypothetical protein